MTDRCGYTWPQDIGRTVMLADGLVSLARDVVAGRTGADTRFTQAVNSLQPDEILAVVAALATQAAIDLPPDPTIPERLLARSRERRANLSIPDDTETP